MAMQTDQDLERDLLLQELEKRKPTTGNTGISGLGLDPTLPIPEVRTSEPAAPARDAAAAAVPAIDPSTWDTDGYAAPKYRAANAGNAVAGFDQTKWSDPNNQHPKYVVGRILQEAAGGSGTLANQEQRDAAVAKVMEAYPGSTFDGKDKITFPDGGTVDVFTGAGAGQYGIAWQPVTGPGGAPIEGAGGGARGGLGLPGAAGASTLEGIQGLMPTDTDFYRRLQEEVQRTLGGSQALDRDALLRMLGA